MVGVGNSLKVRHTVRERELDWTKTCTSCFRIYSFGVQVMRAGRFNIDDMRVTKASLNLTTVSSSRVSASRDSRQRESSISAVTARTGMDAVALAGAGSGCAGGSTRKKEGLGPPALVCVRGSEVVVADTGDCAGVGPSPRGARRSVFQAAQCGSASLVHLISEPRARSQRRSLEKHADATRGLVVVVPREKGVVNIYSLSSQMLVKTLGLPFDFQPQAIESGGMTTFAVAGKTSARVYKVRGFQLCGIFPICFDKCSRAGVLALSARLLALPGTGAASNASSTDLPGVWSKITVAKSLESYAAMGKAGISYITAGKFAKDVSDSAQQEEILGRNTRVNVQVFDLQKQEVPCTISLAPQDFGLSALQFSCSGDMLAAAPADGREIYVYMLSWRKSRASGSGTSPGLHCTMLYRLERGVTRGAVLSMSFSPCSMYVSLLSERGTSHIFAIVPTHRLQRYTQSSHVRPERATPETHMSTRKASTGCTTSAAEKGSTLLTAVTRSATSALTSVATKLRLAGYGEMASVRQDNANVFRYMAESVAESGTSSWLENYSPMRLTPVARVRCPGAVANVLWLDTMLCLHLTCVQETGIFSVVKLRAETCSEGGVSLSEIACVSTDMAALPEAEAVRDQSTRKIPLSAKTGARAGPGIHSKSLRKGNVDDIGRSWLAEMEIQSFQPRRAPIWSRPGVGCVAVTYPPDDAKGMPWWWSLPHSMVAEPLPNRSSVKPSAPAMDPEDIQLLLQKAKEGNIFI